MFLLVLDAHGRTCKDSVVNLVFKKVYVSQQSTKFTTGQLRLFESNYMYYNSPM